MLRVKLSSGEMQDIDTEMSYREVLEISDKKLTDFVSGNTREQACELIRGEEGFEGVTDFEVESALFGDGKEHRCFGLISSIKSSLTGVNPMRRPAMEMRHHESVKGLYWVKPSPQGEEYLVARGVLITPYEPHYLPLTHMTTKVKDLVRLKLNLPRFTTTAPVISYEEM